MKHQLHFREDFSDRTGPHCVRFGTRCNPLRGLREATLALLVALVCWTGVEARSSDNIQTAGDILQFVLPGAAAGMTLGLRDWPGALQLGESSALTLGVTYGLKYTVNERRPNGGNQSFPSGHTSISFSAAEYLRKRYGWEYGIPAYAAASFVAYSRVESNQHYPHDVVAGAAIGIASSYLFTKPYHGWKVQLEMDTKYYGFRITRSW